MAKHGDQPDHAADEPAPPRPDTAVAVALGRGTGKLAPEAAEFLRKSSALLDLQMEHLHEERDIHHRHQQLRYFGDRLRVALQVLGVAGGVVIAIAVGAIAWSAHSDRSLVVEAFSAPPELAQHGVSGRLLANLLLDRLNAMEARAQSVRAKTSYVDSWTGESRVEIPETGISLTEFEQLLHRWLGHQTHITGDAYLKGADLVITARNGDAPASSFSGQPAELDALVQKAAEAIYGQTQPYRYATFLLRSERLEESQAAFRKLAEGAAAPGERAWGYMGFGGGLYFRGDVTNSERQERKALQLKPDLALAHHYLALEEAALGHDQGSLVEARKAQSLYARSTRETTARSADYLARRLRALADETTGDYSAAAGIAATLEGAPDYNGGAVVSPCKTAQDLALAHDPAAARQRLAEWGVADDAGAVAVGAKAGMVCLPRWALARASGNWAEGLADLLAADQAAAAAGDRYSTLRLTGVTPWLAYARMKTGDLAGAQALIGTTPLDCYLCLRVRGAIAEAGQDRPAADAWFTRAARLAPSLPFADFEHGEALLTRGDLAGAAAAFSRAHAASPAFAEPLQAWGELLGRQGDRDGAIDKFQKAAVAAPRWKRPHVFLAAAYDRLGRRADAQVERGLVAALEGN